MPITFYCPRCNKMLRAPDAAAGKSSPCPGCGAMATCPEPVYEAEVVLVSPKKAPVQQSAPRSSPPRQPPAQKPPPVNPYADLDDDKPYALASPPPQVQSEIESRRPCPICGEMILSSAAKCRFCGEVFDPVLKKGGGSGKKPRKKSSRTEAADGRDLVIGFLCFAVGAGLTLASYANAASSKGGSRYFVFYGLIAGGIAGMVRGMKGLAGSGR
jgi:DNA-directed RNA polymerase subunit M/transcription elongation factor TFIIS